METFTGTNDLSRRRKRLSLHALSADCKAEGRNAILGHLGIAAGGGAAFLLVLLLLELLLQGALPSSGVAAILLSALMSILVSILAGIFRYGVICIHVKLQYGQEAQPSDLLLGFFESPDTIVRITAVLAALQTFFLLPAQIVNFRNPQSDVLFWSLMALGLIAGLYLDLTFYPVLYLLLDYPDLSAKEVLQKSQRLMKKHRLPLLYLELSFLPLWLLSVCSFGFAAFWVYAYRNAALAAFYRRLIDHTI